MTHSPNIDMISDGWSNNASSLNLRLLYIKDWILKRALRLRCQNRKIKNTYEYKDVIYLSKH